MKFRNLAAICSMSTLLAVSAVSMDPATAAPAPTLRQRLANVVVPADCHMPRQRLHNGQTAAKYHPAEGDITFYKGAGRPKLVHLRPHGTQLIAQYDCTAGGVAWPMVIVLYDGKNRLIASLDLRFARQEHAGVTSWRAVGHHMVVHWQSYEGAGFDIHKHSQTLRLVGHKLRLS